MAANNYFGFTRGTQYATATGYQPTPQAGYAVPSATYTTPRAAATAYDVASYQTAAATQFAYAKAAYNSAAYDTRQNAYAQQAYPTQPQYAPYQMAPDENICNNITESYNQLDEENQETPSWDLSNYTNRLKTFDRGWKLKFIKPEQMAKAGLYYLGIQDRVRCLFCSTEFDYWQHGDDPVVEHKRQSPQCPFFNDSSAGYDVCGLYSCAPDDFKSNLKSKNAQDFLCSVGILQQIKPLKHKDFATLEARLQSFEKCLMPLKQDIQTLCEAGFFYIGNGTNDYMICYYCNQGLKDWEDNDEPWTEHARWSETCSYVLLNKGKNFVDKACGVTSKKFNPTEFFKLISEHKDTFITENMKVNSTKRKLDQPEIFNISQIKISVETEHHGQKQRDPKSIPDSMLCKICCKEEMKVSFIPCGHVISCIQCALTLEQCAVCRQPFSMVMRVHLSMDEEKVKDLEQLPCSSSQCLDGQLDPMLCKICHTEEMAAAFIPCKHVYTCVKCAANMHECPVCKNSFCATIQVYL